MLNTISYELQSHIKTIDKVINNMESDIEKVSALVIDRLKKGNKIFIFGNGGSAADAQHFAAELTGRYKTERVALPAIALTTDTSALTAIGNDYGYDIVFQRQLEALANDGDIAIGISTSGNSQNVINAFDFAKNNNITTILFSGKDGGKLKSIADLSLVVPSDNTPRIQEMHILFIHIICQIVDNNF